MKFSFIPEDWTLSDRLIKWSKDKGLTDNQIAEEMEKIRDHEYKIRKSRPDACWRNWIRNGIKWGDIVPVTNRTYRKPEVVSESEAEKQDAFQKNLDNITKLKVV